MKYLKHLSVAFLGTLSCSTGVEYAMPEADCTGPELPKIDLADLRNMYSGEVSRIEEALQWEGYVISSDQGSNLFGELYLQDKPAEPEGGIVLYTDLLETHSLFPLGSKVGVNLKGLYLGKSGESYELGGAFPVFGSLSVGRLPASVVKKHVRVSCEDRVKPVPTEVTIESLSDQLLNSLVEVKGVEFSPEEVGMPFADIAQPTLRNLVDCMGNTLAVKNSGYSDFYAKPLPGGHGNATGILTKHRNRYELLLRFPEDVQFSDPGCEERFPKKSSDRILISEIADPDNLSEARFVEIFNASDTDFNLHGWELRRYTNANTEPGPAVSLDGIQIASRGTLVISAYPDIFEATYGFPPDLVVSRNGPADSNGDDSLELIDPFGTVVDAFGVPGTDGSGTAHEFEDGKALRIKGIVRSNPVFNAAEWMVFNDSGGSTTQKEPQIAPEDFTPGTH